jgi:hypothetical protein
MVDTTGLDERDKALVEQGKCIWCEQLHRRGENEDPTKDTFLYGHQACGLVHEAHLDQQDRLRFHFFLQQVGACGAAGD